MQRYRATTSIDNVRIQVRRTGRGYTCQITADVGGIVPHGFPAGTGETESAALGHAVRQAMPAMKKRATLWLRAVAAIRSMAKTEEEEIQKEEVLDGRTWDEMPRASVVEEVVS